MNIDAEFISTTLAFEGECTDNSLKRKSPDACDDSYDRFPNNLSIFVDSYAISFHYVANVRFTA